MINSLFLEALNAHEYFILTMYITDFKVAAKKLFYSFSFRGIPALLEHLLGNVFLSKGMSSNLQTISPH